MNKLIKIPHGNTVSVGAVEACLQATNADSKAPFTSRHVFMQLNISDESGQRNQGWNGNQKISISDIGNALQGSIKVIF
jgi:hypothetical protein